MCETGLHAWLEAIRAENEETIRLTSSGGKVHEAPANSAHELFARLIYHDGRRHRHTEEKEMRTIPKKIGYSFGVRIYPGLAM